MWLPALIDDLVEQVLLRIPPDDPASLVRAALVCKRWCRLISGAGFRRRFREFHGRAPMLGLLCTSDMSSSLVRASSTCPPLSHVLNYWTTIDARHGRILLHRRPRDLSKDPPEGFFVVWDPITNERKRLPSLPDNTKARSCHAAVLCSATPTSACDHLDCHRKPFLVILVGMGSRETFAYAYSSEANAWSKLTSVQYLYCHAFPQFPCAVVGNALYFVLQLGKSIMRFDLGTCDISVIDLPPYCFSRRIVLMTTEGGGLGFGLVWNSTLHLWSRESGSDEYMGWIQNKSIELKTLLPIGAHPKFLDVIGCADDIGVIFLLTDEGIFTMDLKSVRITKACEENCVNKVFPYMSFYTPVFGAVSTAEEPGSGTSSA